MTPDISIYKKKIVNKLTNSNNKFKLSFSAIFNGIYGDRVIDELLNPLILEQNINIDILNYYDVFEMLSTKKNKIKFLDTIIDLFEYIPPISKKITFYVKVDDCHNIKSKVSKYHSKLFMDLKHNFDENYDNIHSLNEYLNSLLSERNYSKVDHTDRYENLKKKNFCLLSLQMPKNSKLLPLVNTDIKFVLPPLYKWKFIETQKLYSIADNLDLIESIHILKNFPNINIHYYSLIY